MLRCRQQEPENQARTKVNIKLDAYPYLEFGTLQGLTHTIEYIPDGNYYLVEVQIVKI